MGLSVLLAPEPGAEPAPEPAREPLGPGSSAAEWQGEAARAATPSTDSVSERSDDVASDRRLRCRHGARQAQQTAGEGSAGQQINGQQVSGERERSAVSGTAASDQRDSNHKFARRREACRKMVGERRDAGVEW